MRVSPARKPRHDLSKAKNAEPLLSIVQPKVAEPRARFDAATQSLHEIFLRVFDAIRALSSHDDLLIGRCAHLSPTLQVELASGIFTSLKGRSLNTTQGALQAVLKTSSSHLMTDGVQLQASDLALACCNSEGEAALFRVKFPGDESAILLYWHPASSGRLESSRVEALRLIIGLAAKAAGARPLSLDMQAREADLATNAHTIAVVDLASGVAHEINNPLTIILNKADEALKLLKDPNPDLLTVTDALMKIQQTSVRISDIIKSLNALAKHEEVIHYGSTCLSKILSDVLDLVSEKFKSGNVKLETPSFTSYPLFEVNDTMISQLLLNLINNAFDAVQTQPEKWVKIDWAENEESVFLYITDSGPGIPVKIRGRIFDPFFTTKEPGKGTGLGLSLAASIVAHHDGQIRIDTSHPHTRFVVQLPKQRPKIVGE